MLRSISVQHVFGGQFKILINCMYVCIFVCRSLDGLRFAVTSGSKCVPVCTYDQKNDW